MFDIHVVYSNKYYAYKFIYDFENSAVQFRN